ncbi:ribosomal protein S18-alanine N-acetyltransferase [Thiohalobacter sp. IOR34]|uniref:ribosomal protein S18-alanine N-acetyltransferase n=1 Tax=Thiohalobacter sp. IOR34 TaxID=3057176 RepID=UPI0025B0740B|nr:ribosomal protein S18-alanine N-acetyltransferase [Thiohalobacter sp. IOR34]WJW76165.1 ribosomal protein S18-alanine N-acetyltransferase [Thiohalobacter sp. IOR34]
MAAVLKQPGGRYRPMTADDVAAVMEIERRAYPYPWTEGILRDCLRVGYNCWVHECEGRIEGYAVMSVAVGEAHILNLCVRPESQGRGLGRRLLRHLISVARRNRADTLFLEVRPSNRVALRLYEALGFVEVGRRRDYYPAGEAREDALVLARPLEGEIPD